MEDESPLGLAGQITEFNDLSKYMQDPDLDKALHFIVQFMAESPPSPAAAVKVIVKLQAMATSFAMKGSYYQSFGRRDDEASNKKQIYYSARDSINRLIDAVKYLAKV